MSPLKAENIMDPDISLKEKAASWIAMQGVPTCLLFAILYVMTVYGPDALQRIEAGYTRNADLLMQVAKQRDETLEKLIVQWKDDRRLLIEILRSDKNAINSLLEEPANHHGPQPN